MGFLPPNLYQEYTIQHELIQAVLEEEKTRSKVGGATDIADGGRGKTENIKG